MSALPGCEIGDMKKVSQWFRSQGWQPQQCQCFIPTPGTVATAMFYAGIDTSFNPIHIPKTDREREDQHKAIFWNFNNTKGKPHLHKYGN